MTEEDDWDLGLACPGDIDGDGIPDLVVGDPDKDEKYGVFHIIFLDQNGNDRSSSLGPFQCRDAVVPSIWGHSALCGFSLTAGDFNGDNYVDLALGMPGSNMHCGGSAGCGGVMLLPGPFGASWTPSNVTSSAFIINNRISRLESAFRTKLNAGAALATIPDIDGDGADELAVGAPSLGNDHRGRVFIVSIDAPGKDVRWIHQIENSCGWATINGDRPFSIANSSLFGRSLSAMRDAKGRTLLAIGTPGRPSGRLHGGFCISEVLRDGMGKLDILTAHCFDQGNEPLRTYFPDTDPGLGNDVAWLGDINGDRMLDLAVGIGSDAGDDVLVLSFKLPNDEPPPLYEWSIADDHRTHLYRADGGDKLNLTLTAPVLSLYVGPSFIDSIVVETGDGGETAACTDIVRLSPISAPATQMMHETATFQCKVPPGTGTNRAVTVTAGLVVGNTSSSIAEGTIRYAAPAPMITAWTAPSRQERLSNASSQWTVTVTGENFGTVASEHVVFIGGAPCGNTYFQESSAALVCEEPPQCTGRGFPVTVSVDGVNSEPGGDLLDYAAPEIASVGLSGSMGDGSQPVLLDTRGGDTLAVRGLNLGMFDVAEGAANGGCVVADTFDASLLSPVLEITIDNIPCAGHAWESDSLVECLTPPGSGVARAVQVTVMGSPSNRLTEAVSFFPPAVNSLSRTHELRLDGGETLFVAGSGFGPTDRANATVVLGSYPCEDVQIIHDGLLQCTTSGGVGAERAVVVSVDGQLSTESNETIAYALPVVYGTLPPYVLQGPVVSITLLGDALGRSRDDVDGVWIAGDECPEIVWHNSSAVTCHGVSPAQWPWLAVVDISVQSQSPRVRRYLDVVGDPRVFTVTPGFVPSNTTADFHGQTISIWGTGFGRQSGDIVRAWVDHRECTDVEFISESELRCVPPMGVGAKLSVEVENRRGFRSGPNEAFSYSPPTILAVHPNRIIPGEIIHTISIHGIGLGVHPDNVTEISIGGAPCSSIEWMSSSEVQCAVSALEFESSDVRVRVADQWATNHSVMTVDPVPLLVSAAVGSGPVKGGYIIAITGRGLGWEETGDIVGVWLGPAQGGNVSDAAEAAFSRDPDDRNTIHVTIPPGMGSCRPFLLQTRGQLLTDGPFVQFSYDTPVITTVIPTRMMVGDRNAMILLEGENLGHERAAIDSIVIDQLTCAEVVWYNDTLVACAGLDTMLLRSESPAIQVRWATAEDTTVSQGLLQAVLVPQIGRVEPSVGGMEGGYNATLTGFNFGSTTTDMAEVWFGGTMATGWELASTAEAEEERIVATVPAGTGSQLSVYVRSRAGAVSNGNALFSYAPPSVASVMPSYLFARETDVSLDVYGANLGIGADTLVAIAVCNDACPRDSNLATNTETVASCDSSEMEHVSHTHVRCNSINLTHLVSKPGPAEVTVVVLGVANTTTSLRHSVAGRPSASIVRIIGDPSISLVHPASAAPLGGTDAFISGSGFGDASGDVVDVYVGTEPAERGTIVVLNDTLLSFSLPPGVGGNKAVRVVTRGGGEALSGPGRGFSYYAPHVEYLDPSYQMIGNVLVDFTIWGNWLGRPGRTVDDIDSVSIGENPCSHWALVDATEPPCGSTCPMALRCTGVNATGWAPGKSQGVDVVVGGQHTKQNGLFTAMGAPAVHRLFPTQARSNETIAIVGANFGRVSSDITAVTIDGEMCDNVTLISDASLQCSVPIPNAARAAAAQQDPTALANLAVRVHTRNGQRSGAKNLFHYAGFAQRPNEAPVAVAGRRDPGIPEEVNLSWEFRDDTDVLGIVETVTTFEVQYTTSEPESVEAGSWEAQSILRDAISTTSLPSGQLRFTHRLSGFGRSPLWFRILAVNSAGRGPASNISHVVPEQCLPDQFLPTHRPISRWLCAPCVSGAVCGGGDTHHVAARAGYWRIPWSRVGLAFAKCPREESCLGWETGDRSYAEHLINRTQENNEETAARQRQLRVNASVHHSFASPRSLQREDAVGVEESCARGHEEILCTVCSEGYVRSSEFQCTPCESNGVIAMVWLAVLVAVIAVVAFVIWQAIKSKGKASRLEIAVMKIIVTHLQSVAIVATFHLQWPETVSRFFSVADASSSVSPDVVSLECTMNESARIGGSSFFSKSLLILLTPVLATSAAALFWIARACCRRNPREFASNPEDESHRSGGTGSSADVRQGTVTRPEQPAKGKNVWGSWSQVKDRVVLSCIVVAFLLHTMVTRAALQLLTCTDVEAEDDSVEREDSDDSTPMELRRSVLRADMSIECHSNKFMVVVAVLGLVTYGIGIPLVSWYILWKHRKQLQLRDTVIRERYGFLFSSFRKDRYYWESVIMARKATAAVIGVLLAPVGVQSQAYLGLLLFTCFAMLHARSWPYTRRALNQLDMASLAITIGCLFGGLALSSDETGASMREAISVLIVVINAIYLLAAVVFLMWCVCCKSIGRTRAKVAEFGNKDDVDSSDSEADAEAPRRAQKSSMMQRWRGFSIFATKPEAAQSTPPPQRHARTASARALAVSGEDTPPGNGMEIEMTASGRSGPVSPTARARERSQWSGAMRNPLFESAIGESTQDRASRVRSAQAMARNSGKRV